MKKLFSKEIIQELSNNPYVASITETAITFTQEFKQLFYEQKKSGVKIRIIFENCNIPPDALGDERIKGFSYRINRMAKRSDKFTDMRTHNGKKSRSKSPSEMSPEERIRHLEKELEHTKQVLEFLKAAQQLAINLKKKK